MEGEVEEVALGQVFLRVIRHRRCVIVTAENESVVKWDMFLSSFTLYDV